MVQMDFLLELFTKAKEKNIHTCLDTSGITFRPDDPALVARFDRLMAATDLVMLDLKQVIPARHKALTGQDNAGILAFARYLSEKGKPLWIRHVVIPGHTDDEASLSALGSFMAELSTVSALDVLPYHTLGTVKWERLQREGPILEATPPSDELIQNRKELLESMGLTVTVH